MRKIAHFTVEDEPIAKGGMGQIFRGKDDAGNEVAIKEILPEFASDFTIISRIEKEVDFLLKVNHPSIVRLHSAFRDPQSQSFFIVMEMVEGLNIEQYVIRNGAIPTEKAVELMLKILDALQCVHNAHIIHRDIKPSNIMIRPDGGVCLLDFGVAKDIDAGSGNATIAGSIIGTNGYMSPEQAEGYSINFRSDIYSLGCVFYFMLTGHHAFNTLASEFETKDAILTQKFPLLSKYIKDAPEWLQNVLDRATERNMMKRYATCYEFSSDLCNGTHISNSGVQNAPIMLTLGRELCDIIISDKDRKISRHHADIELKEFTGGKYFVFTDCSSNGSRVNETIINNKSIQIPFNGPFPTIILADVHEGRLDWDRIRKELDNRRKSMYPSGERIQINPKEPVYEEESALGLTVTAFILSILGGFLGLLIGIMIATSKVKIKGVKYYKYLKIYRQLGWLSVIIGVISMIVWIVLFI